jgi:hypothetical protein
MDMARAKELAASLRASRTTLTYFPHRYAAWLLGRAVGEGAPKREVEASPHGRFLDNLLVRQVAARAGDGVLTRQALEQIEPSGAEVYSLGATTWGASRPRDWFPYGHQMTRPGANLVLLLCFSPRHDAVYRRLLDPAARLPAVESGHPHARPPRIALAWARLDVEVGTGEALIEEVQSDWIRELGALWSYTTRLRSDAARDRWVQRYFANPGTRFDAFARYWQRVLANHRAWWPEATLFAALQVLRERFGVRRVYYHTYEGGKRRKKMFRNPPRSLYTRLPQRFGFAETTEPPRLLATGPKAKRRHVEADGPPWYRLDL